jgi:hypothetical protein
LLGQRVCASLLTERRRPLIKLFFCLIAAMVVGVGVILVAGVITENRSLALLGDGAFVATLGILIWRTPDISLGSAGSVLGAVTAFVASGIFLAGVGGVLYFSIPWIGRVLVHIFSIGFYPAGADVPFEFGALFWAFSMIALCAAGLAIGGSLRWLKQRQDREHS